MLQDKLFNEGEGNKWFQRNKKALTDGDKPDWPCHILSMLGGNEKIGSVLELGCANGWRLNRLRSILGNDCRYVGIDASREAIEDGLERHPGLVLHQAVLTDVPIEEEFDLAIVNFVLHWVDRRTLLKSIGEIDRMIRDGGFLILGDFLPDFPQRRHYHHCPGDAVYTYKQDYAAIFTALGTYREIARVTYNHDAPELMIQSCSSAERGVCVLLQKSLTGYYREV